MDALKRSILDVIEEPHLASFATVTEDGKPWVRYVMPKGSEDMTIRFATFSDSRKVKQIRKNPEVHLTCGVTDPTNAKTYLQVQGRAEFVTDEDERNAFWNKALQNYFSGPDDPKYGIVIVKPYRIEVNAMGKMQPEVWEA